MEIFDIKSFPPFLFILLLLSQNPFIFIQKSCVPTQLRNTSSAVSLHFSVLKTPFQSLLSKCRIIGSMRRSAMPVCLGQKSTHLGGICLLVSQDSECCDPESCCLWKLPPVYEPVMHFFLD